MRCRLLTYRPKNRWGTAPAARSCLDQLRRQLTAHVWLNNLQIDALPLALCVVGPTGEGKTFNVRTILNELGVRVYGIAASAMAHHQEGMALFPFIRAYRDASMERSSPNVRNAQLVAVMVDDIDRSIASGFEKVGHTLHSQLVTGLIMHLCDNPYTIPDEKTREMVTVSRIPLVLTANRISGLDAALRRPQRMTMFKYHLEFEEKVAILGNVFYALDAERQQRWRTALSMNDVRALLRRFPNQPVAFFADIVSQYWVETTYEILEGGRYPSKEDMELQLSGSLLNLDFEKAREIGEYIEDGRDYGE